MSELTLQDAQRAYQMGQLAQAARLYQEVLSAEPGHLEALYSLGMIFFQANQLEQAEALFSQVLRVAPYFVDGLCMRGVTLVKMNRTDEALACFKQAIAIKPDSVEALSNHATTLVQAGRYSEGLQELDRVLALNPQHALSWNNRGNALFALNRNPEAVESYDRALAIFPEFPDARLNRLYALGDLKRATPEFPEILVAQGVELMRRQDFVDALRCFDEALAIRPDYPEASAHRLATLRGGVQHLFDECAPEFEASMLNNLNYRGHMQVRETAEVTWTGPRSGLAIADLGCGTGLVAAQFKDWASGGRIDGVDFAPRMLEEARTRGIFDNLILSDLEPFLQESGEQYDLLLTADTMIYFSDLSSVFAGVAKRLKPGGQFIFSLEAKHGEGWEETPKRRFRHSEAYLRDIAERTGLKFLHISPSTLRFESGMPVAGFTVAVQK
jgi:predicted TPR repeat methyltransferase/predicted negative regulator of RcsB-dependent stress response